MFLPLIAATYTPLGAAYRERLHPHMNQSPYIHVSSHAHRTVPSLCQFHFFYYCAHEPRVWLWSFPTLSDRNFPRCSCLVSRRKVISYHTVNATFLVAAACLRPCSAMLSTKAPPALTRSPRLSSLAFMGQQNTNGFFSSVRNLRVAYL